VEHPTTLYAKGALMRGMIADKKSPIVYGYTGDQMPVYFSQDPVLRAAGGGGAGRGGFGGAARQVPGVGVDITRTRRRLRFLRMCFRMPTMLWLRRKGYPRRRRMQALHVRRFDAMVVVAREGLVERVPKKLRRGSCCSFRREQTRCCYPVNWLVAKL